MAGADDLAHAHGEHVDPNLHRPAEVDQLIGDASRARQVLGWQPQVDFAGLVEMMVDADRERARAEKR